MSGEQFDPDLCEGGVGEDVEQGIAQGDKLIRVCFCDVGDDKDRKARRDEQCMPERQDGEKDHACQCAGEIREKVRQISVSSDKALEIFVHHAVKADRQQGKP